MQLKIFAVLLTVVSAVILSQIRIVESHSKSLQLAAFGFRYDDRPLTGVVYDLKGFQPLNLTFVWNGRRHGPDIQWFPNGQRFIERHYRNGLESGTHKAWYPDGKVKSLKNFSQGLAEGEFYDWHANGQLAQFVLYKNGKEVAAKSWTSGGKPFYNYVWREESQIGLQGDRFCSPIKK